MSRRPDATGVEPTAIVGVSYAGGHDARRRRVDFTPAAAEGDDPPPGTVGGASALLAFIEDELRPSLASRVELDPDRQTIVGHSLAGFFVLWVLTHHTTAFSNFAAISPSLWWNRALLTRQLPSIKGSARRVFLTVGEWEGALPPWQVGLPQSAEALARRQTRRMIEGTSDFAEQLAAVLGTGNVVFELLANEDHASIVSAAMPRILRFASRGNVR